MHDALRTVPALAHNAAAALELCAQIASPRKLRAVNCGSKPLTKKPDRSRIATAYRPLDVAAAVAVGCRKPTGRRRNAAHHTSSLAVPWRDSRRATTAIFQFVAVLVSATPHVRHAIRFARIDTSFAHSEHSVGDVNCSTGRIRATTADPAVVPHHRRRRSAKSA